MSHYDYDEWLRSHSGKKSLIERLERSMLPFELFGPVLSHDPALQKRGTISHGGNSYEYAVDFDRHSFGNDIFNVTISAREITDRWHNPLLKPGRFKVIVDGTDHSVVKTIYADSDNYFAHIAGLFARNDFDALHSERSDFVNNLLARWMIATLLKRFRPGWQILANITTPRHGFVRVAAANANHTELVVYAFSKLEAIRLARRLEGVAPRLTVVYFFNSDYANSITLADSGAAPGCELISFRALCSRFQLSRAERNDFDRKALALVSWLHNERLRWEPSDIERIACNPPRFGTTPRLYKQAQNEYRRKYWVNNRMPWWERSYESLVEDALNVLDMPPAEAADCFHFLCAANVVNARINRLKQSHALTNYHLDRLFKSKTRMFAGMVAIARLRDRNFTVRLSADGAVLADACVAGHMFHFSFRGASAGELSALRCNGARPGGVYSGYSMQTIASALYLYSCGFK